MGKAYAAAAISGSDGEPVIYLFVREACELPLPMLIDPVNPG
jgi:hypothetical protein